VKTVPFSAKGYGVVRRVLPPAVVVMMQSIAVRRAADTPLLSPRVPPPCVQLLHFRAIAGTGRGRQFQFDPTAIAHVATYDDIFART
jgi:hypothetical protein